MPVHFRISIKKAQNLHFFDLTIFLLRARLSGKANMNDNRKFSKNSDGSHDFGGECSADDMILQNAGEDFGFDDIESDDDKAESIKKRLEAYRSQTAPVIGFYRDRHAILDLDARHACEKILENFKKHFPR